MRTLTVGSRRVLALLLGPLLVVVLAAPPPAHAAWPNSATGLAVCTATGNQSSLVSVADGSGGAFLAWHDYRSGSAFAVVVHHVLASGVVDPAWPADGRLVYASTRDQEYPALVADGTGGVILTWIDNRDLSSDIYAQHVLANGTLDPAWPVASRAVCTSISNQGIPQITSDGTGGAIIAWYDFRDFSPTSDLYAQHVLANGAVDPAWPVNGRAICTAANGQASQQLVPDGAGGAIIAWQDKRAEPTGGDIYAQHVLAGGVVDPAWPADGRALSTATNYQSTPQLAGDGSGGAYVAWFDARNGNDDIYAMHVLSGGGIDPQWPADGRAICTAAGAQGLPRVLSDGAGGALIVWHDSRGAGYDIYAQHVQPAGVDPAWPANGLAVCTASGAQWFPTAVGDGAGGAIVTWADNRTSDTYADIYAQHVLGTGTVDPAWPASGRALCTAAGDQQYPVAASDGAGGAVIAWLDPRSGAGTNDVYAGRVARFGYLGTPEAEIVGVADVPADQGGWVKVSWNASWLDLAQNADVTAYTLLRSVPSAQAAARLARGARASAALDAVRSTPGAMFVTGSGARTLYWETVASIPALHYLAGYSAVAATPCDSMADANPWTSFLVVVHNASGSMFWPSQAASGYSVDDLAPAMPAAFTGRYANGATELHWAASDAGDLAGYRLYRGGSIALVPAPANLAATVPGTDYVDEALGPYVYKLTAVDVHGNVSPAATLVPAGTTDAPGPIPAVASFAAPSPNPTRGACVLRYSLARGGRVRLELLDAAGRHVRTLVDGAFDAGTYGQRWDGRDDAGRAVAPGLYFARIAAPGLAGVRRLVILD